MSIFLKYPPVLSTNYGYRFRLIASADLDPSQHCRAWRRILDIVFTTLGLDAYFSGCWHLYLVWSRALVTCLT